MNAADPRPRLNVIGCGRVGQTLARIFHVAGLCRIQQLNSRRLTTAIGAAEFIGAGQPVEHLSQMLHAELWLVSVPDSCIGAVVRDLADLHVADNTSDGLAPVAFHCSGFKTASELEPLRRLDFKLASVHPVLTFASPATAVAQFPGTACGMEGDAAAISTLRDLFSSAGALCFEIDAASKPLYHAAAVFCTNFTVVMQALADEAWRQAGVPADLIRHIQDSLLEATAQNVAALGPAGAITGPAARGDNEVVRLQGEVVSRWHPQAGELYGVLSGMARALALKGSTHPQA